MLSCRLTSAPLWLGIYLFLWWFLLVIFGLFLLHWRYELPCQDKLPEFHSTPILGCIRILWLVSHPLGLGLDKALCGWNSVSYHRIKVHLVFAVKFDCRHKARLVADGHLTPEPIENIYSGVVSLRNLSLPYFSESCTHHIPAPTHPFLVHLCVLRAYPK